MVSSSPKTLNPKAQGRTLIPGRWHRGNSTQQRWNTETNSQLAQIMEPLRGTAFLGQEHSQGALATLGYDNNAFGVRTRSLSPWFLLAAGDDDECCAAGATVDFQSGHPADPVQELLCLSRFRQRSSGRGLRLDERDSALLKRKSGKPAIMPGEPGQSELLWRVAAPDESQRMPPAERGGRLKPEQVVLLRRWIAEGAPYAEHWAFVKPLPRALPAVNNRAWPRNGLDAFILARLEKEGLTPADEADRFVLLRRVSLDLRGCRRRRRNRDLRSRFQSNAYERAVDRFLGDPAYGERLETGLARPGSLRRLGRLQLRIRCGRSQHRDWVSTRTTAISRTIASRSSN